VLNCGVLNTSSGSILDALSAYFPLSNSYHSESFIVHSCFAGVFCISYSLSLIFPWILGRETMYVELNCWKYYLWKFELIIIV